VNLLLIPYLMYLPGTIRNYEPGLAIKDDIDTGMMLGCVHPMEPLALLDFVDLDTTCSYIASIMFDELKDPKYARRPFLKPTVTAGYPGKRSGSCSYDYTKG